MTASRPSLGKLSGSIRGISRIRASKPCRSFACRTPSPATHAHSTSGSRSSGDMSKSGKAGPPPGLVKSPERAMRNLLISPPPSAADARADLLEARLDGAVERPHVARVADEVEALPVQVDALIDRRHQAAGRLVVLPAGLDHRGDRVGEVLMVELARDAERGRQIKMPDPEAVDALGGG